MAEIKFGEFLVNNNAINMSQLMKALREQVKLNEEGSHAKIGEILVKMRAINKEENNKFLDLFEKEKSNLDDDELGAMKK
jgi:hypothetical protein